MAFISSLISVAEPSGVWISIIKAFEAVTNNYVLAVIFLTVVIRLAWGLVDLVTKFNTQRMSEINSKLQPELDIIKNKYQNQPNLLQQKQNELYKKHYGKSYYAGCLVTMLIMALNMFIFFTLFSGLNTMSSYKITANYDNIKYTYANCLNVANKYWEDENIELVDKQEVFKDYENLRFSIKTDENNKKSVILTYLNNEVETELYQIDYKDSFSETVNVEPSEENPEGTVVISTNENIIKLIDKYFPTYEEGEEEGSKEVIIGYQSVENEDGTEQKQPIYLSSVLSKALNKKIVEVYDQNQEKFLWIQNIWIADSPFNKSIISYDKLRSQVIKNYIQEGEETIYNAFMPGLKEERSKANGYFILLILIIVSSLLSVFITKYYNKRRRIKKGLPEPETKGKGQMSQIIIPVLFGFFALLYNSVFAIYMLIGQVVSCVLTVPQLMFVDWLYNKINSKKEKTGLDSVDYSRKF